MKNILFFSLLLTGYSFANDNIVFQCQTAKGKTIKVSRVKNGYQYSFGTNNKPELVFSNTTQEVINQSPRWSGSGRSIISSMTLKNGPFNYTVSSSTDRLTDEHEQTFGLTIEKDTSNEEPEYVSNLPCSPKSKIIFNFDDEFLF